MYVPSEYRITDLQEALTFIKRFNFGAIVTTMGGSLTATHLPFIVENHDDTIILTSHLARANPQWRSFKRSSCMVVFSEPHAYISPLLYHKKGQPPTWNYLAVHLYGRIRVIDDEKQAIQVLKKSVEHFEPEIQNQWDDIPEEYIHAKVKALVAFEMTVTHWQGKKKLSQNKSVQDRMNVIQHLNHSEDSNARMIATYMKNELEKDL